MKRLALVIAMVAMMASVCFADEITDLKAKAYELLVMRSQVDRQLVQVETRIVELSKEVKVEPKE